MSSPAKAEEFAGTVDFGVLTVREDEMEPFARRCREKATREQIIRGRQDYLLFDVVFGKARDLTYRLALARSIRQGAGESQRRATNLIEDLDPTWLMLVGIAGATPSDEFTLGDVVVATELHEFSVRAAVFGKQTEYRPGGGAMAPEVEDFIALLSARDLGDWNQPSSIGRTSPPVDVKRRKAVYGDADWRDKVRKAIYSHFPTTDTTRKPQISSRPFAGGNVLIKDDALWQSWQFHARQVEAVEMELEGVYTAARTRRRTYPILVSKGISDVVGFRRDGAWTKYACETAAAGALAMLALRPVEPRVKLDLAHSHLPNGLAKSSGRSGNAATSTTPVNRSEAIKAFVSYKWIDPQRDAWVKKFATDLRAAGIDALLDRWEVKLGESFTEYMSSRISEADVILFVITPQSVAAVEEEKGKGGPLKFEMQMTMAKMINGDGRVIGIYREGDRPPRYLRDKRYADFRDDSTYERSLMNLIADLTGLDEKPPLGKISQTISSTSKTTSLVKQTKQLFGRAAKRSLTKEEREIEELQKRYDDAVSGWYDANYSHMDEHEQDYSGEISMYRNVMEEIEKRLAKLGAVPRIKPI